MEASEILAEYLPIATTTGLLVAACAFGMIFSLKASITGVYISLFIGQLIRIPLQGQGGGLLVSDIAVLVFLLSLFVSLLRGELPFYTKKIFLASIAVSPFLLWGLAVLVAHVGVYQMVDIRISFLYWIRLAVVLSLLPAAIIATSLPSIFSSMKKGFVYLYGSLLVAGFVQLFFLPSLAGFVDNGWDPHVDRMVSTWLDPNFLGIFFVVFLPIFLYWMPHKVSAITRIFWLFFAVVAIGLTESRSSYLALLVAGLCCGIIWVFSSKISGNWKKAIVPGGVLLVIIFSGSITLLRERAYQVFFHDPTIALRAESYRSVWRFLVSPNMLFGVGYNAYQFAAANENLVSSFSVHSRAGSDNSIFTILVTTGMVGALLFFTPMLLGVVFHIRRWLFMRSYNSLFFVWATIALLVHAQFVNSLLYPHVLIPYIIFAALTL